MLLTPQVVISSDLSQSSKLGNINLLLHVILPSGIDSSFHSPFVAAATRHAIGQVRDNEGKIEVEHPMWERYTYVLLLRYSKNMPRNKHFFCFRKTFLAIKCGPRHYVVFLFGWEVAKPQIGSIVRVHNTPSDQKKEASKLLYFLVMVNPQAISHNMKAKPLTMISDFCIHLVTRDCDLTYNKMK